MSIVAYPCPSCGQTHQLDYNYLSQYGGQTTICTACQRPMPLPTVAAFQSQLAPPAWPLGYGGAGPVLNYAAPVVTGATA